MPDRVDIHLDRLLAERGLTLTDLSSRVGVTVANLSILKNGRARAIRFSTLTALCEVLDCQACGTAHSPAGHPPCQLENVKRRKGENPSGACRTD